LRARLRMFYSRFSKYYALRSTHFYWNIHILYVICSVEKHIMEFGLAHWNFIITQSSPVRWLSQQWQWGRTVYSEFAVKLRADHTKISAIVVVFTVRPHGEWHNALFRVVFAVFRLIGIGLRNTLPLRSVTSAYDYSYYHASLLLLSYVVACWRYIIILR